MGAVAVRDNVEAHVSSVVSATRHAPVRLERLVVEGDRRYFRGAHGLGLEAQANGFFFAVLIVPDSKILPDVPSRFFVADGAEEIAAGRVHANVVVKRPFHD
jgi:hypothetical protein